MKTTNPLHSGHLMTRILRLQEDIEGHSIAVEGMNDEVMTFHKLKHWNINRYAEIKSSLNSIHDDFKQLVVDEYQEIETYEKRKDTGEPGA